MRDHKVYGLNQVCFFTHYIIRNYYRRTQYINQDKAPQYAGFKDVDFDFSALFSTCLGTMTSNACIYPYKSDLHNTHMSKYTFCSTLDLSLAVSNEVIIRTPVFIYAKSPSWSR